MDKIQRIIAVDIDGCIAEPLGKKDRHNYSLSIPIKDTIAKINKLYEDRYVIIYYTWRALLYYEQTYAWLIKHGCKFHALRMGKLHADYYIDNNNINIEDL